MQGKAQKRGVTPCARLSTFAHLEEGFKQHQARALQSLGTRLSQYWGNLRRIGRGGEGMPRMQQYPLIYRGRSQHVFITCSGCYTFRIGQCACRLSLRFLLMLVLYVKHARWSGILLKRGWRAVQQQAARHEPAPHPVALREEAWRASTREGGVSGGGGAPTMAAAQ